MNNKRQRVQSCPEGGAGTHDGIQDDHNPTTISDGHCRSSPHQAHFEFLLNRTTGLGVSSCQELNWNQVRPTYLGKKTVAHQGNPVTVLSTCLEKVVGGNSFAAVYACFFFFWLFVLALAGFGGAEWARCLSLASLLKEGESMESIQSVEILLFCSNKMSFTAVKSNLLFSGFLLILKIQKLNNLKCEFKNSPQTS